jgi:hypothetical protein
LIASLPATLGKIVKTVIPRTLKWRGLLGFEDPYYTGTFLRRLKSVVPGIDIIPDFTGEVHDITVKLEGKIVFIVILFHVLRFLFLRRMFLALKKIRRLRNSRKMQPQPVRRCYWQVNSKKGGIKKDGY